MHQAGSGDAFSDGALRDDALLDALLTPAARWLLMLAHPGHELRAFHLLERVHPLVVWLTDGSGSIHESRLEDSQSLLANAGGRRSATFGLMTDRDAYKALMAAEAGPFLARVDELCRILLDDHIHAVLVDAAEGYNPAHDVCHWIGRAAVLRARERGARIDLFELDLVSHPDAGGKGVRLMLDDSTFARKLDAISRYGALKAEVEAAFARYGQEAFRVEFLRRVVEGPVPPSTWVPHYERVGEDRVREGRYASALRYAPHVRPVLESLVESVQPAYATDLRPSHQ